MEGETNMRQETYHHITNGNRDTVGEMTGDWRMGRGTRRIATTGGEGAGQGASAAALRHIGRHSGVDGAGSGRGRRRDSHLVQFTAEVLLLSEKIDITQVNGEDKARGLTG